jgi:ABC-2 type transport system ATP-binding protein
VVASGSGNLAIVPIVGDSGPQLLAPFPFSLPSAAKALYALDVTVQAPATTTQIVGAPTLTMTYSGVGTSRHVYAQLVDDKTGLVVGNTVTPYPSRSTDRHTVTVPLEDVAYTMSPDDRHPASGRLGPRSTKTGRQSVIEVSSIELVLPTAADAVPRQLRAPGRHRPLREDLRPPRAVSAGDDASAPAQLAVGTDCCS